MVSLDEDTPPPRRPWKLWTALAAIVMFALIALSCLILSSEPKIDADICKQPHKVYPSKEFKDAEMFGTKKYVKYSAELLGGAVRIPTESFDDMNLNVTAEPRFEIFKELHHYLHKSFPLTSEHLEYVNTYGLLYTIKGSDPKLKPVLLMAHQDVVPVNSETINDWDHPPFSGLYDGEFVHGRGAADTKNSLVAALESTEALLEQEWKPKRTVLIGFGFDEEISGPRGAHHIAETIHKRYGENSVEIIIDEGSGMQSTGGTIFALPAVAEKGRIDLKLGLHTLGGHSSMPPDHTGIGILAELAVALEKNPFKPELRKGQIMAEYLGCVGSYAEGLDRKTRNAFMQLGSASNRAKAIEILEGDLQTKFLLRTSQAIDIFNGGIKVNALPEYTEMVVDHRVDVDTKVTEVIDRLVKYAKELCHKFELSLSVDGTEVSSGHKGNLTINYQGWLDPAPIASFSDKTWDVLAGTVRQVYEDVLGYEESVVAAPFVMGANTDTAHFWKVSDHIYRFTPIFDVDRIKYHTVNERVRFRGHIATVMFYYNFLINTTV